MNIEFSGANEDIDEIADVAVNLVKMYVKKEELHTHPLVSHFAVELFNALVALKAIDTDTKWMFEYDIEKAVEAAERGLSVTTDKTGKGKDSASEDESSER